MALDKPYKDVPGTIIFDAEQSRLGYWLNQFCTSLMKAENRARFLADERAYLDEWPMTEEQKQAVMARDLNWCMRLAAISTSWRALVPPTARASSRWLAP
jgi:protocatechuate 4,5-dioxygenase alpha chain